jgi:dUTPase
VENKKKRFYKKGEIVWVVTEKREGTVMSIDKEKLEVTISFGPVARGGMGNRVVMNLGKEHVFKIWEIDKLKYKKAEELGIEKTKVKHDNGKKTYFASVKGGIIPTKTPENAGRDAYARLDPVEREGRMIYELHIPRFTLAKIPLGFASYLHIEDLLSLKHERSSIGSMGLINVSGLIDSTYQGEVVLQVVPLIADIVISSEVDEKYYDEKTNTYFAPYKKAIAQAVVIRQSDAEDVHISYDELLSKPSERGVGGWGSSGK